MEISIFEQQSFEKETIIPVWQHQSLQSGLNENPHALNCKLIYQKVKHFRYLIQNLVLPIDVMFNCTFDCWSVLAVS